MGCEPDHALDGFVDRREQFDPKLAALRALALRGFVQLGTRFAGKPDRLVIVLE